MRVATFNIQHGRRPDGKVDLDALVAACSSLDADVLALQEVDRGLPRSHHADQAGAVAQALGMDMLFSTSLSFPSGGVYGNVLLVRGQIAASRVDRLPRLWRSEPRTAICAEVAVGGSAPFGVVVTHLSVGNLEARWQLRRALRLAQALAADEGRAVLLMGDLNLGAPTVERMAIRRGWRSAVDAKTFPAEEPRRQIDFVLLHEGTGANTIGEAVRLPVSDHLALIVQIRQE